MTATHDMSDDNLDTEVSVVANAIGYTFQVVREQNASMGTPVVDLSLEEREWVVLAAIRAIAHLDSWRAAQSRNRAERLGLM